MRTWNLVETGARHAPPLLFVHGFPIDHTMWLDAAVRLGERARCLMPDLRGHGRSPLTPPAAPAETSHPPTIATYADDLATVLDEADEHRPVVVVGLSMGGIIAFEFFRRHRARIAGLVLCDTRIEPEHPEGARRRHELADLALREGTHALVDTMLPRLFAPSMPPERVAHWRAVMSATPREGAAAASRALASRPDSRPTLAHIDLPTLVCWGDRDEVTPLDIGLEIHRGVRASSLAVIPRAAHVPPIEQPDAFAAALRAWLDSTAPSGTPAPIHR